MRQIAILALIVLAVSAAGHNCSSIATPAYNFYKPPMECVANDTAVAKCNTDYTTCTTAGTTCAADQECLVKKLRCFEDVTATSAACSNWVTMFSNEKLYITAGGDYNGSSLELSCRTAVCAFEEAHKSSNCTIDVAAICTDKLAVPSTIPPAGVAVVSFTIGGDKAKFTEWLAKDKVKAFGVVARILAKILGTDASNIVIIDIQVGSLKVDFYTTDASLDVATVQSKMKAAETDPTIRANAFAELATETGISVTDMTITGVSVVESTPTPATPNPNATPNPDTAGTPTPPLAPDTASAVATTLAVVATIVAMLF